MHFLLFSKFLHLEEKRKLTELSVSFFFAMKKCDLAYISLLDRVFVLIVTRETH